nr:MAG TPA: hypothetical protein [Caudoviricetes sp.]
MMTFPLERLPMIDWWKACESWRTPSTSLGGLQA